MEKPEILFEDNDIIVCHKPAGVATQTSRISSQDMESLLKNYRASKGEEPYIAVIHRLDQGVEGILVFAKNPKAAASLNKQLQQHQFSKEYYAVVSGEKLVEEQVLEDWMKKDGKNGKAVLVDGKAAGAKKVPGAKHARLRYEVVSETNEWQLLRIYLETGRFHQIRLQLSSRGAAIVGDRKYGGKPTDDFLKLCAYRLEFAHPISGDAMRYEITPWWFA